MNHLNSTDIESTAFYATLNYFLYPISNKKFTNQRKENAKEKQ